MSSFTTDPDEVEQMLVSSGSQNDLGAQFSESFREFKADIDGREIVLTASHKGGANMRVGGVTCHREQNRGLSIGAEYHMAFRFDYTTEKGSILVRDITAGTKPYLIECTRAMERRPPGRSDTLVLGMGLTPSGQRSAMGFQGSVKHIMLYDSSISDAGANVFYGGQSQLNNHNLAITYNGARLLKSEDNGVGLKTNESCLIEDHAQPFSFWRIVRDCTDKEKADRAGTACYKYYAGHLNALDPRTKYELRSSVDEYVLEKALESERKFNSKGIGEPLRIGRSFQTHLNIKVWGAGGGLAPEWRAKNPKRPDAMSLGCAEQELIHGYAVCKTGWQTDKCEDKGGVEGDESYVVGDHKCVLPGLNRCVACLGDSGLPHTDFGGFKVRVCVRPAIVLPVPSPIVPLQRNRLSPRFGLTVLWGFLPPPAPLARSTATARTTNRRS